MLLPQGTGVQVHNPQDLQQLQGRAAITTLLQPRTWGISYVNISTQMLAKFLGKMT